MLPHHAKYYDGHIWELNQSSGPYRGFNQSSGPYRGFGQVAYKNHAKYSDGRIQELKQYSLVLIEVLVETHMTAKVIPRVMGGVLILQQLPPAAINNATPHAAINSTSPNLSKMIKRQVLPAALHMFLRQHKEKTPSIKRIVQTQWTTKRIQWCQEWPSKSMGIRRNKEENH